MSLSEIFELKSPFYLLKTGRNIWERQRERLKALLYLVLAFKQKDKTFLMYVFKVVIFNRNRIMQVKLYINHIYSIYNSFKVLESL